MKQIIFKNNYTRDTTIILQQIWALALSQAFIEKKNWKNPHAPVIIHYMINGTMEIWDNDLAIQWIIRQLQEENVRDPKIFFATVKEYEAQLEEIKKYWARTDLISKDELKKYIDLLTEATFNFNVWYYAELNENSPKNILEKAHALREEDRFFSSGDVFLAKTLRGLYPEIAGFENQILINEAFSVPSREVLEQRKNGAALIDGQELFLGNQNEFAQKYPLYILEHEKADEGALSVKGQVAFKGIVRGKVRILRQRGHVGLVKKGEIIVSPMTTPDFLPAMQNAAAFVTDEGGITCHAAIVARELKKPCVIGTKVATKVFKDGDFVEVNAEEGIVSIVKE